MGAAAALDRLPARRQGCAVRHRGRSRAARERAAIASTATSRSTCQGAADYVKALKAHKVILDPAERAALIAEQARALAKEHKLALVEDEALLAENAGLTEWPLVLMGNFDEAFLAVPAECLMVSMKQHQKCFSLKHPRSGKLANRFLLVSNLTPTDGGTHIVAGNEKVIRARLSRRQVLLGAGPQEAARRDGERAGRHHLPREARAARRSAWSASPSWPSRSPARWTRCPRTRGARRSSPRPIWCPAWSASSPSCRA